MGLWAGLYGAGGGLVLGLIAGLVRPILTTGAANAQIQSEQQKDRNLSCHRARVGAPKGIGRSSCKGIDSQLQCGKSTCPQPVKDSKPKASHKLPQSKPQDNITVASRTKPPPPRRRANTV